MKKKQTKAPPVQIRAAPDDWQHFWDGEAPPLVEEMMRKRTQAVRVAKEHAALSIKARTAKNLERDRRIHDAHTAGKTPNEIAADRTIRGKKKLTASTIRRILKAPCP